MPPKVFLEGNERGANIMKEIFAGSLYSRPLFARQG
jgi:hypothetical protein